MRQRCVGSGLRELTGAAGVCSRCLATEQPRERWGRRRRRRCGAHPQRLGCRRQSRAEVIKATAAGGGHGYRGSSGGCFSANRAGGRGSRWQQGRAWGGAFTSALAGQACSAISGDGFVEHHLLPGLQRRGGPHCKIVSSGALMFFLLLYVGDVQRALQCVVQTCCCRPIHVGGSGV